MADTATAEPLLNTPLHGEHAARGARMVPFAGYAMPVQYPTGILAEHQWTRENAGLFDVSHMGQAMLAGPDHDTTALALETLVPADILGLPRGRQRYALLLNEQGGIRDDLMVARPDDPARDGELYLVVNASTKEADYHYIEANLPDRVALHRADNRALLALQGPRAETALARHAPEVSAMAFMDGRPVTIAGMPVHVSRSGYTGEDGFEISVPADEAVRLWRLLLQDPLVKPIGLGARDSLRLEAGLCLYGQDVNQETSPVEAALAWTIPRRRRQEGGFPGEIRITQELAQQPLRLRVGLRPEGRVPAREGAEINDLAGELVGEVTSGGFGPTVGGPIAMGYVVREFAEPGTALTLSVRGKTVPAEVVPLPFVPHRYRRR